MAHLACPTAVGRVEAAQEAIWSRTARQRGAPPRTAVAQPQARPYALCGRSCQGGRPTPLGGARTRKVGVRLIHVPIVAERFRYKLSTNVGPPTFGKRYQA